MATFPTKTAAQITQDYLNTISAETSRRTGKPTNVSFNTKYSIDATALGNFGAQIYNAVSQAAIAAIPSTAQGQDLIDWAASFGLSLKPASGSTGSVVLFTTILPAQTILITAGTQLQDMSGLLYQVSQTISVANDGYVPVTSIDVGAQTNLPVLTNGLPTILRWVTIPPYATGTVNVAEDFVGGADQESLESLRTRLLNYLDTPPGGGNWSQTALFAQNASPAIQAAFVYPCCDGPASEGVAVVSAPVYGTNPLANYSGRDFGGAYNLSQILNTKVIPAVIGQFPEFANFIITGCDNQPISVSIGLDLPNSPSSSTPGDGTGWIDSQPFPIPIIRSDGYAYETGYCDVSSVNATGTIFNVNADITSLPANHGLTPLTSNTVVNIGWLSSNDWILRTAQAYVTSSSDPYQVTLTPNSTPFVDTTGATIQPGDWIFPLAVNTSIYVASLLSQFATIGPGQKVSPTVVSALFPRANRRPLFNNAYPCNLGPSILKFLENTGPEVLGVQYIWRQDVITPFVSNTPLNASSNAGVCPIPTSVLNEPFILTPNNLAFYPQFPVIGV